MRTTSPGSARGRSVRRASYATASVVLAIIASGDPSAAASTPGSCTVAPVASSTAGPELLGTFRLRDGIPEILHVVRCTDGRWGSTWIGADVIPS
jgi:hypothetical protein